MQPRQLTDSDTDRRRDKLAAALITVIIVALTFTAMMLVRVSSATSAMPVADDADEQEIFFADIEYTDITTRPTPTVDNQPANSAAAEVSGTDLTDNAPAPEEPAAPQLTTAREPSPAKQSVDSAALAAAAQRQEQERQAAAIRSKIGAAAFGKTDQGQGQAANGRASVGNNPGARDGLGLDGRRRLNEPRPAIRNVTGKMAVKITVDASGAVTQAMVVGSEGFGQQEEEVRRACLEASRQLRYSADAAKPTQTGTIIWNIK